MSKIIKVALVGQPNVGKSLLINQICNSNMKVGNFAGVTVEKAQAKTHYKDFEIQIVDLPGIYSLNGYSEEEKITKEFIENEKYDLIVNVLDSTNLERNLLLSSQLMEEQKKMILVLNMCDEAKKENININIKELEKLLNIPCIFTSANTKENLKELLELIIKVKNEPLKENKRIFNDNIEKEIETISEFLKNKKDINIQNLNLNYRQIAVSLLKQDEILYKKIHDKPIWMELSKILQESLNHLYSIYNTKSIKDIFIDDLNAFANGINTEVVSIKEKQGLSITQKIDKILIHKYLGIPIFLFFIWGIFQLTFTLGEIPMEYIEEFFAFLGDKVKENVSNELIASLIADGIIGGVGAVILFLPNIMILFFGISLLETTGYMSRVAFLLDGFLHKFGLHGKSFIPLISGFGCSVPAFMATRTLKSKKDRLLTLFIINFMSCGARLSVYVLFVGAFFSKEQAGNVLFGIYILGAFLGLIAAFILRKTAFKGPDDPFVMEMPKYRMPNWNLVYFSVINKAKMYLKKAGTFILATAVIIWFASTFPLQNELKNEYVQKIEQAQSEEQKQELEFILQEQLVENSYLGQAGKFIDPLFKPLGFDWKMSVALLSGLAAKEVTVSTMGVLYSLGEGLDESSQTLMQKIKEAIPFEIAVGFILFIMTYNPCLAATMVFGKEAGSMKYSVYLFLFTTLVAYIVSYIGIFITKSLI